MPTMSLLSAYSQFNAHIISFGPLQLDVQTCLENTTFQIHSSIYSGMSEFVVICVMSLTECVLSRARLHGTRQLPQGDNTPLFISGCVFRLLVEFLA